MIKKDLTYSNGLIEWAKEVIKEITPLAEASNLAYYPLQSPAKERPKYLFVGLNPAQNFQYSDQKRNSIWEFIDDKMTADRLLKGNPTYESKDTWTIIKGIRSFPVLNTVLNEDNYVFMNYFYANTADFGKVLGNKQLEDFQSVSKELTYKFIDLVKPEIIIVLGTANGIDKLDLFTNQKTLLQGVSQKLIVAAEYKDTPVYAIPHPSWLMLQQLERQAIDCNLKESIEGKPLSKFDIPKSRPITKFDLTDMSLTLSDNVVLRFEESKKGAYGCEITGIDNEQLTIRLSIDNSEKFWSIRSSEKGRDWFSHLKYLDTYKSVITNVTDYGQESWLFRKHFENYGATNKDELKNMVIYDMQLLLDVIKCHSEN